MAETKYTEEHEWIRVEGDVGTIGITQYAQEQLGDKAFKRELLSPAQMEKLGDAGKRALQEERRRAREARASAKAAEERAAAAESRLAQIERDKMSAQERAEAERDDWRRKYEEQQADLARLSLEITRREVAAEKGIPDWMARRLQGSTREELEADAEAALADLHKVAPPSPYPPNTPRPDPNQGPTGQGGGRPTSVADAKADYLARRQRAQTH